MPQSFIQRWAAGALALSLAVACSRPAEVRPARPELENPAASGGPARVSLASKTPVEEPGYAGVWALAEPDCKDAKRTLNLSSQSLSMAPGGKACVVKSREEEHPTGRSMIYHILADCGGAIEEAFRLNFGASDTIMQMTVNDHAPVRLVRCPTPTTP